VGEKISFRLREWSGSTLITDNKVTLTPTTTDWQEITNSITAAQNGTRLSFAVYGEDVDANEFFYMDDMSLESTLIDHEWALNASVDSNLDHWDNPFASSPYITIAHATDQMHSGAGSVKVTALTGASNLSSGVGSDGWMANGKVEAGKTYDGSVWVKPSFTGQQLVLRMREFKWNGTSSDLYNEVKIVHTAASTDWQKVEAGLTASEDGSGIGMIIHGKGLNASDYFYADDFSVTSIE
jgi:hypothetical protein